MAERDGEAYTTTMSTRLSYRQNQAIEIWISSGRKSKADALRKAGYSEAVIHVPGKVFDSPRVQDELELRGHGRNGLGNRLAPRAEMAEASAPRVDTLDLSKVTEDQIRRLREQLAEIGYVPVPPKSTEVSAPLSSLNNLGNADSSKVFVDEYSESLSSM